jgi:hypothetical protein
MVDFKLEKLRADVMSVVPQPDHRSAKILFISDRTQACRAQEKGHAIHRRFESDPACGQHPNEVSAREKQHVSFNGSHAPQHVLSPRDYLGWRFASRAPVAEQLPVRALCTDLCRASAFVFAVIPLDEIVIDFGHGPESSQCARPAGALQRARKDLGETQARQSVS